MISHFATSIKILAALHKEIFAILEEVGVEGMNWKPGGENFNSLYTTAYHTICSQNWWITENLNQVKIERDRTAEFKAYAENLDQLYQMYESIQSETKRILETVGCNEIQHLREVKGRKVSVEWIVIHVVEHTALHLGHMQVTKQLWEEHRKGMD